MGGDNDFWKWWSHAITNHEREREREREIEREREENEEGDPPCRLQPE